MFYKLSNTANRSELEKEFGAPLQYSDLYRPALLINGLNEETILMITSENPNYISPAIWGLLPEEFVEDWSVFQGISNTLNISVSELSEDSWKSETFIMRRCLIVVTGFFTAWLHEGRVYPYYVSRIDGRPFAIAGIYNRLEDGFLTCSILIQEANEFIGKVHNLCLQMPMILPTGYFDKWLDPQSTKKELYDILSKDGTHNLKANLIAKEFYNNNITYDSMLEPVSYKNLEQIVRS